MQRVRFPGPRAIWFIPRLRLPGHGEDRKEVSVSGYHVTAPLVLLVPRVPSQPDTSAGIKLQVHQVPCRHWMTPP